MEECCSDDAHLQRLVLGLRNTAALAGMVRDFVSERQAGAQLWVLASRCNMLEQRVGGLPTWHTWLERMPAGLRKNVCDGRQRAEWQALHVPVNVAPKRLLSCTGYGLAGNMQMSWASMAVKAAAFDLRGLQTTRAASELRAAWGDGHVLTGLQGFGVPLGSCCSGYCHVNALKLDRTGEFCMCSCAPAGLLSSSSHDLCGIEAFGSGNIWR